MAALPPDTSQLIGKNRAKNKGTSAPQWVPWIIQVPTAVPRFQGLVRQPWNSALSGFWAKPTGVGQPLP